MAVNESLNELYGESGGSAAVPAGALGAVASTNQDTDEEYGTIEVLKLRKVKLGRQGENGTQDVVIDCSAWMPELSGCELMIAAMRPGERKLYLATVTVADNVVTWPILAQDTARAGWGRAEVRAMLNGQIRKSRLFVTYIEPSIEDDGSANPPTPPDWVQEIIDSVDESAALVEAATMCAINAVRFDEAQGLEDAEQAQARENISAAEAGALEALERRVNDIAYEAINITSLSFDVPSGGAVELGSSVSAVTLKWTLAGVPVSQKLNGETVPAGARTIALTENPALTADKEYTLQATDAGSPSHAAASASRKATLHFYNNVYYGAAAAPATVNSAFVTGLANKVLTGAKARTISVNAASGQYIWYAVPKRLEACSFNVGGFDGGFESAQTVSVTNASGHTEDYYVYRSTNAGLGNTTVTVK